MELIWIALVAILGVIGAACSRLLADETKAWLPWLTEWLIQRAVSRLPDNDRPRRDEEWRSHVNDTPGDLGKIFAAAGFCRAARSLCKTKPIGERRVYSS